jgi:signal transduction histidine kinase/CheY-like chemotaxis protein/HPt (histidine-containing phosphotransfer) domain-containing protein
MDIEANDPNKERLELALEAAGLDLWENDLVTGAVRRKPSKVLRELGYDESEVALYTDDLFKIVHPDDIAYIKSAISAHVAGVSPQYRCEFRLLSKKGEWIWFANYGKVMDRDGAGPGKRFIGVTFNIHDRKLKENEIDRINQELKEQIRERQAREEALHEANLRVEAAARAKSTFFANMSHEIRTPMNAIIGLSHLALKTPLNAQQRDYVAKIHGAGTSLLGIINDILDFSKIEAGKIEIEATDFQLDRAMEKVATMVGHLVAEKRLELVFDISSTIPQALVGDSLRLEQILTNLVSNAVKFTESGMVLLRVEQLENIGTQVKLKFSVCDTGIGMTPEQQQRLFQAFTQADGTTTRKYGGTGLGLTIAKRLVELMGGSIWVESLHGVGSTFSFTAWFRCGEGMVQRSLPDRITGLRVLIVDDNAAARRVLAGHCASLPLEVDEVASGHEAALAVKRAERMGRAYGLVLLDWAMPQLNGIETARMIKCDAGLATPPAIVMVTAFGGEDLMARAGAVPLDGFLIKPVSASTLVDTLVELYGQDRVIAPAKAATDSRFAGLRVLLVEDNAINQLIATELMSGAGILVDVADNGRIALDKLRSGGRYDIVLMDLQMPEMDGYAATEAMRADPSFRSLPIVAMTAHAMAEERQRCADIGMNDHIAKPIDPDVLFATLARWDQRSQQGESTTAAGQAEENDSPASTRWIDTASALRRTGGNTALYHRLLGQFAATQAGVAAQIEALLAAGDRTGAMFAAHNVKGTAGNLGATALFAVAGELESAISGGKEDAVLMRNFAETCAATVSAIRRITPDSTAV